MKKSPEDYCLRMILKMCHYLSEMRFYEVLAMKADFYIDSNDQIWFVYAQDIVWRDRVKSQSELDRIAQI